MSKLDNLLWQKSKGEEPKCFGVKFSEFILINKEEARKPEEFACVLPMTFKTVEFFSDGNNLECFRCLDNVL